MGIFVWGICIAGIFPRENSSVGIFPCRDFFVWACMSVRIILCSPFVCAFFIRDSSRFLFIAIKLYTTLTIISSFGRLAPLSSWQLFHPIYSQYSTIKEYCRLNVTPLFICFWRRKGRLKHQIFFSFSHTFVLRIHNLLLDRFIYLVLIFPPFCNRILSFVWQNEWGMNRHFLSNGQYSCLSSKLRAWRVRISLLWFGGLSYWETFYAKGVLYIKV